jgi:hypothetical protein
MLTEKFVLNDHSKPELMVIAQTHKEYDALTVQLTRVVDLDNVISIKNGEVTFGSRFIYEEISLEGLVTYARYMCESQISSNYPEMYKLLQ